MNSKKAITHLTQYYETDQMKVVHHANYIKWMEEARNSFLKSLKININDLNNNNIYMAVLFESVKYIKSIKYDENIKIVCFCDKLSSVKIGFSYEFYNEKEGYLCAIGKTEHCFVNDKLEPIVFKKTLPKEYALVLKTIE